MERLSKTQRALEASARGLVTMAVVIAPWLFGAADPWAYLLICGLVGLACTVWLFALVCTPTPRIRAPWLAFALVAMVACVALQTAVLPGALPRLLNPLSAQVTQPAQELLAAVAAAQEAPPATESPVIPLTLSLAPLSTHTSLAVLIACVSAFLVILNTARRVSDVQRMVTAVVVSCFIMAVLGMVHKFSGSQEIFWFHTPRYGGNILGPFSNRNHFAAFMNMAFGLALGLFMATRPPGRLVAGPDWRDQLAWLSSRNGTRTLLTAFAMVVMGGAVCISLSRGAILSLAVSFAVACGLIQWRLRALASMRRTLLAVAVLVGAFVLWLGIHQLVERMGTLKDVVQNPTSDFRFIVTHDTLRMFAHTWLTGVGFGAYRHAYPLFQTPPLTFRWLHAHNDWAQLLAEGGLLGAGGFLLVGILWYRHAGRRFALATDKARLLVLGAAFSLLTIALHSVFDYSLHKPANALMLAFCAAVVSAGVHEARTVVPGPAISSRHYLQTRIAALVVLAGLSVLLPHRNRDLRGALAFSRFLYLGRAAERASTVTELTRAVEGASREASLVMSFDRFDADALSDVTSSLLKWSGVLNLDRGLRTALLQQSADAAFWSVCAAPSSYLNWLALARAQMSLGRWDEANLCLQRARELVKHPEQVKMFAIPHPLGEDEQRQIP